MSKLPEKLEQATDTTSGSSVFQIRDAINQIITYLEERDSGMEQNMNKVVSDWKKQRAKDVAEVFGEEPKQTLTLKKPEWWESFNTMLAEWRAYREALDDVSKALGITIYLE